MLLSRVHVCSDFCSIPRKCVGILFVSDCVVHVCCNHKSEFTSIERASIKLVEYRQSTYELSFMTDVGLYTHTYKTFQRTNSTKTTPQIRGVQIEVLKVKKI